jgi:hypothetical protein
MNRQERQQQRTNRNRFWLSEWKDIADALRERTGQDWTAERRSDSYTPFIDLRGNVPLFAKPHPDSTDSDKALVGVNVSPELHGHEPHDVDRPSIGLTFTKGAVTVAKDIQRRLLQDAADYHLALVDQKRKDDERERQKARERDRVEKEIGETFGSTSGGSPKLYLTDVLDDGHGHVRQLESGSYQVEVRALDVNTLLDILHALQDS